MLTPTTISEFDRQAPDDTETATFGLGCFWGPDALFGSLDGVIRTRVGYAGGTKPNPSYELLGDHTEVVQLEYDPTQLSFTALLERAFSERHPYQDATKQQYQTIIFTHSAEQRAQLSAYLDECEISREKTAARFESFSEFYLAEAYHQKFNLRGKRWITSAFAQAGYDDAAICDSPVAAKLNGHLAGHPVDAPFVPSSYEPRSNTRPTDN